MGNCFRGAAVGNRRATARKRLCRAGAFGYEMMGCHGVLCVILVRWFSRRISCAGVPFTRALTPKLKLRLSTVFPTVAGGTIRPYRRAIRAPRCDSFPLDPCRAPSLTARGSCLGIKVLRTGRLWRRFLRKALPQALLVKVRSSERYLLCQPPVRNPGNYPWSYG